MPVAKDHANLPKVIYNKKRIALLKKAGNRLARTYVRVARALRNHTLRAFSLGLLLTLLAICLDWGGKLVSIERLFYDRRARFCQFFTPAPIDKLVHVDIDDAALEEIGRWPWPRTTLGEIVDELRLAGADALALDILLTEPEPPNFVRRHDGSFEIVDHDANLSAALKKFGRMMVPVTFDFTSRPPPTPQFFRAGQNSA